MKLKSVVGLVAMLLMPATSVLAEMTFEDIPVVLQIEKPDKKISYSICVGTVKDENVEPGVAPAPVSTGRDCPEAKKFENEPELYSRKAKLVGENEPVRLDKADSTTWQVGFLPMALHKKVGMNGEGKAVFDTICRLELVPAGRVNDKSAPTKTVFCDSEGTKPEEITYMVRDEATGTSTPAKKFIERAQCSSPRVCTSPEKLIIPKLPTSIAGKSVDRRDLSDTYVVHQP